MLSVEMIRDSWVEIAHYAPNCITNDTNVTSQPGARSRSGGIHRQVSGFSGNDNGFGHRHSGKPLFDGDDPRFSDLCAHRSEAGATTLS